MKAVFMGTPEVAVPTLAKMLEAGIDVPLVVTQPDRPKGRGNKLLPTPVKAFALEKGLNVVQPEKVKGNTEFFDLLRSVDADFFVVIAYGRILPDEVLKMPKKAPINVHFSLLPKYRGAAPVNWAVINGDKNCGVTTMFMDVGLDTGDILLTLESPVERKTAADLLEELAYSGGDLLVETIKNFDSITPVKQVDAESTYAPLMTKEDGLIRWAEDSAVVIERKIRGFYPWPAVFTNLNGRTMKIFRADVCENKKNIEAGKIFDVTNKTFKVACAEGALEILELQPEGKKRMETVSFLAGNKPEEGTMLG